MASRLKLHEELCDILGSRNVYFQPPESIKMIYPGIVYYKSGIYTNDANDNTYKKVNQYSLTVIDRDPDTDIHDKILDHFMMCSFDRVYISDNLNHYVLNLYY